jgi:hypothetical protein
MNNPHNTLEELALYAMQSLSVEESASIAMHLQTCTPCRTDYGQVSVLLALMGFLVQERELPSGACERFMERVAAAASVQPQDTPAGAGKNRDDFPGTARIFEISTERIAGNSHSSHMKPVTGTVAASNSAIEKNSLLRMKAPASITTRNKPSYKSKITIATPAPVRVWAARVMNIF